MRSSGQSLIQSDPCPSKKTLGPRHAQRQKQVTHLSPQPEGPLYLLGGFVLGFKGMETTKQL